ncbi:MAG: hypothetical protein M1511_02155 [Deltaproteobacteria bacterium]|nr:hypothetical protein [Deltaproteobacteria bacterium]
MWFVPDGRKAFFNGEAVVDLIPIPGMAHVRKIEPIVSDVCHSSEPDFKNDYIKGRLGLTCPRDIMVSGGLKRSFLCSSPKT